MGDNPANPYATLGVDRGATAEAITAAFRAAARRLHPDVPETGDVREFLRIKAAYDLLGDPRRRAAYDRSVEAEPEEWRSDLIRPAAPAPSAGEAMIAAWRRPSAPTLGLFAGGACLAVVALALGFAGLHSSSRPPQASVPRVTGSPPAPAPIVAAAPPVASPVEGNASAYILPGGDRATLWKRRPGSDGFVPGGPLDDFTVVALRPSTSQHGMVEIALAGGATGYVYANRLAPGTVEEAKRARCIYEAGTPPANNEVLDRHGSGPVRILVENRRDQPAVVKLRTQGGSNAASVFLAPRGSATVDRLPVGSYRPEFAFGELWSHACRKFVAGMRAQRFGEYTLLGGAGADSARFVLPPDAAVDEADDEFNRG